MMTKMTFAFFPALKKRHIRYSLIVFLFTDNMMDDSLKIKVLMIYFDHWGKEESRIYKNMDGLKKFDNHIHRTYETRYETALETMNNINMKSMRFWQSLVDCLLYDMVHWVEYYDYMSKPVYMKIKFAENIGAVFYDVAHVNMADAQMKNVDSIVALPVMKI